MSIAITLQEYLDNENIVFDLVEHPYSRSSMESAESAHIPGDQLAKCVVLEDDEGFIMAVVPSTHRIDISILDRYLGRKLDLATEDRLRELFYDCEVGAIPPIGGAYGYEMILDDSLMDCEDIYFEAGDHVDLVHLSGEAFHSLMEDVDIARFSYHI